MYADLRFLDIWTLIFSELAWLFSVKRSFLYLATTYLDIALIDTQTSSLLTFLMSHHIYMNGLWSSSQSVVREEKFTVSLIFCTKYFVKSEFKLNKVSKTLNKCFWNYFSLLHNFFKIYRFISLELRCCWCRKNEVFVTHLIEKSFEPKFKKCENP